MEETKFKEKFLKNWNDLKKEFYYCLNSLKKPKGFIKQIPNFLTASRLLSPFLIIPIAFTGNILLASLFACGFAATDLFDGFLARKLNATSEFGRKLDPITDKVFVGSLLIPLIAFNPIILLNLIGEIIISVIIFKSQLNDNIPKTNMTGKFKITLLYLSIIVGYIGAILNIMPNILNTLILTTGLLQITSGYEYYDEYNKKEKKKNLLKNINETTQNSEKSIQENQSLIKKEKLTNKELIEMLQYEKSKYSEDLNEKNKILSLKK